MMPALAASVLDPKVWEVLAGTFSAMTVWAQGRQQKAVDPVADLTERLRSPLAWAIKHPLQAVRRIVR